MKSNLLRVSVIAVAAAAAACAQNPDAMKANVPFNFVVCGKTIPAGEVTVARVSSLGALAINGGGHSVIVLGGPEAPRKDANHVRLVFHRYGDAYFLAEVWGPDQYHRTVPQTSRERELSAKGPASIKTIALSLR
jgi:hypothetical protein